MRKTKHTHTKQENKTKMKQKKRVQNHSLKIQKKLSSVTHAL